MARAFSESFYHSTAWKKARLEALKRDGFCCTVCGQPALEVHHIIPLSPKNIEDQAITLDLNNLECLCFSCHRERHFLLEGKKAAPNKYEFAPDGRPVRRI